MMAPTPGTRAGTTPEDESRGGGTMGSPCAGLAGSSSYYPDSSASSGEAVDGTPDQQPQASADANETVLPKRGSLGSVHAALVEARVSPTAMGGCEGIPPRPIGGVDDTTG